MKGKVLMGMSDWNDGNPSHARFSAGPACFVCADRTKGWRRKRQSGLKMLHGPYRMTHREPDDEAHGQAALQAS